MIFDQYNDKPYVFFVKLPQVEDKFAFGCKTLRSASLAYIIGHAKNLGARIGYSYSVEPIVYCLEISSIVADDTALSFFISKGYSFEVFNGINGAMKLTKKDSRITNRSTSV